MILSDYSKNNSQNFRQSTAFAVGLQRFIQRDSDPVNMIGEVTGFKPGNHGFHIPWPRWQYQRMHLGRATLQHAQQGTQWAASGPKDTTIRETWATFEHNSSSITERNPFPKSWIWIIISRCSLWLHVMNIHHDCNLGFYDFFHNNTMYPLLF